MFFGRDSGPRLFGTVMQTPSSEKPDFGVVFFQAFGEERQKSYRSTFVFASRLAKQGIPSFRFDCSGVGDSEGDMKDTTVEQMLDESVHAVEVAKHEMGVNKVILLGIRMGAAIAVMAAPRIDNVSACILWNPIIKGSKYFRELMRTEMIISLARKREGGPEANEEKKHGLTEVDAELLTTDMVEQIKAIDLSSAEIQAPAYFVTTRAGNKRENSEAELFASHARQQGSDVACWTDEPSEYWTARSMHDAYYPTPTFDATLRWLGNQGDFAHA